MRRATPIAARVQAAASRSSTSASPPPIGTKRVDVKQKFAEKVGRLSARLAERERRSFAEFTRTLERRLPTIRLIERTICRPGRSRLVTVGSLATQLAVDDTSDIDLCFLADDAVFQRDFLENRDFRSTFMDCVAGQIGQLRHADAGLELQREVFPLYNTRVPLLIANFKNGLALDVQFVDSNMHAIKNTNLCRTYAAADSRFRQVYQWLRTLCLALGVKNSKDGLFSSYHLMLLVIHFLQYKASPPVVPVLATSHAKLVGPDFSLPQLIERLQLPAEQLIDWRSANEQSAGELAVDLVAYYSSFDPFKYAIDVAKGRVFKKTRQGAEKRLLLYDPYSPFSVAHSSQIPDAFRLTFDFLNRQMQLGKCIDALPTKADVRRFQLQTRALNMEEAGIY
ncbi:Poly(A) RNA polymerase gld-2-like protein A [Aphelenchoides fujianensis]|nr:Poly(A) RNA polymerase gld-2-like protein A [Aphelenchoides fujianensis]